MVLQDWKSLDVRKLLRRTKPHLPRTAFVLSVFVLAFISGYYITAKKWYPYSILRNAHTTAAVIKLRLTGDSVQYGLLGFTNQPLRALRTARIVSPIALPGAAGTEHFLMTGGVDQYLEFCPHLGCIAVEYTRQGKLVHAYPYEPNLLSTRQTVSLPYETLAFAPKKDRYAFGLQKLPDGDLIVIFGQEFSFPFGGGIARIRPDGSTVWFRHDYSHHWPVLMPHDEIAVPSEAILGPTVSFRLQGNMNSTLQCDGKIEDSLVNILDLNGHLKLSISLLDSIIHSPYRGLLFDSANPCDPIHLNYITPVTAGMVRLLPDVMPDDFLVSLHNLDAFAILGRRDRRLKYVFRGDFLKQHSVQPLGQTTTVLIFDNHGGDWRGGPSRLIAFDLATRAERTLLPNANAPGVELFTNVSGNISVSPDALRLVAASLEQGKAYEIRISDGAVLTTFDNLHDVSAVSTNPVERLRHLARLQQHGVYYVH